jgi:hypothetical protein
MGMVLAGTVEGWWTLRNKGFKVLWAAE